MLSLSLTHSLSHKSQGSSPLLSVSLFRNTLCLYFPIIFLQFFHSAYPDKAPTHPSLKRTFPSLSLPLSLTNIYI